MIVSAKQNLCLILILCASGVLFADALKEEGVNALAIHELGITGQGVHIGLLSHGNVRDSHIAFERDGGPVVTNLDFAGSGLNRSMHDTNMAGLLVAKAPLAAGIVPGAAVYSARIVGTGIKVTDFINAFETLITKHNCRVIVTGIQLPSDKIRPDGNSIWSKMYDYYAENYDVFLANAAGNESPQITVFGDSYNGLTTAALKKDAACRYNQVGRISNSGPTADGRKKPEVAAPSQGLKAPSSAGDGIWMTVDPNGLGLTSFAVPFTAGTAAMLLEMAAKNKIENDDRTEVLKAVIVNSVYTSSLLDKKGNQARPENSVTWNPDTGYGRLNALAAYKTLNAGPIKENEPAKKPLGWAYGQMPQKGQHTYLVNAEKNNRLILTVTWHRKINKVGSMFFEEPVPFSMDVKVVSPSGKMLIFETPAKNNLIKADCTADQTGTYQITLRNTTAIQRDYAMAFELLSNHTSFKETKSDAMCRTMNIYNYINTNCKSFQ